LFAKLLKLDCEGGNAVANWLRVALTGERRDSNSVFGMKRIPGVEREDRTVQTDEKIAMKKRTLRGKIEIDVVTHHENHEPWLQVGAPNVSQRFQPPWWSPGWCPFPPLCRRLSFVAHDCHREKPVDHYSPQLCSHRVPPFFIRLSNSPTQTREWRKLLSLRKMRTRRDPLLLMQACGKIRIYAFAFLVII